MWLVRMIVWILGRYMCTRGGKDIVKILWCEIKFEHFKSGPDAGIKYVHYVADEIKIANVPLTSRVLILIHL